MLTDIESEKNAYVLSNTVHFIIIKVQVYTSKARQKSLSR